MLLGSEMLMSLKRGLGLWWTRTISAEEQSEGGRLDLFLVGVSVTQHISAFDGGSVGGGWDAGVEPRSRFKSSRQRNSL